MKLSPKIFIFFGITCFSVGFGILALTFYPVIKEELGYAIYHQTHKTPSQQNPLPIDPAFDILIPKLGANARIIPSVDPYNAAEYQLALTRGVAQTKGTAVPGESGNIFLFSHSSVNFYDASRYNSIFYLINKLDLNDSIILYYKNIKYSYRVTGKKLVSPKDISYLTAKTAEETVTLMTCWPPGTTYQRLLVFAKSVTE
jgi:LPXTG-site transpeptidase (sortase) family protein